MVDAKVRNKKNEKRLATALDYKICFSTEHGDRVLKDLLGFCGFGKDVFNQNHGQNGFNQGKQCVANEINDKINSKPKD